MSKSYKSFQKFCETLYIEQTAQEWKDFYESMEEKGELDRETFVSIVWLERLQDKYQLFSVLYEDVLQSAERIRENPYYLQYTNLLRLCVIDNHMDPYISFAPMDKANTTIAMAPLFALLAHIDDAEEQMLNRGIPVDMRKAVHKVYERILINRKKMHAIPSISVVHYFWSRHYLRPDIYPIGELEFEISKMPAGTTIMEQISNGLASAVRDMEENEEYYAGHLVLRGGLTKNEQSEQNGSESEGKQQFSKKEYRVLLQPGDDVLSVHIPRNAKIDAQHYMLDYKEALAFFGNYYPECHIKAITCHSWLMDPELKYCVKEGSNILEFQRYYKLCPAKSSGKEVFSNVFFKQVENYEELPENTGLERGLKKRYLENCPIYAYRGVHMLGE